MNGYPGMTLRLPPPPRRSRPNLTALIDVVVILLIFFMIASRFEQDRELPLDLAGAGAGRWEGGPRLVVVTPAGLLLNGRPVTAAELPDQLRRLLPRPDAPVILRPGGGATLQALVDAMDDLQAAGIGTLLLAGAAP